jgi:ATP-dependent Lon protease
VTGMGEGAMPVESIATPSSGLLKLTGSLGEVRPDLIRATT